MTEPSNPKSPIGSENQSDPPGQPASPPPHDPAPTHNDSSINTPGARLRRNIHTATWFLLFLAAVIVGFYAGTSLNWMRNEDRYSNYLGAVLWAVGITLVVVLLVGYGLFKWYFRGLGSRVYQGVQTIINDWEGFDDPKQRRKSFTPLMLDIAKAAFAYLAFAGAFATLAGLLANLTLIATLGVQRLQVDRLTQQNVRLDQQNQLIKQQGNSLEANNQIIAIDRVSDIQLQSAQRHYDEINRIFSSSNSVSVQVYAIQSIPEVMVMPVDLIAMDHQGQLLRGENDQLTIQTQYPNMEPLKARFLAYIRDESRVQWALKQAGLVQPGNGADVVSPEKQIEALKQITPISNAIVLTLHRLGRGFDMIH